MSPSPPRAYNPLTFDSERSGTDVDGSAPSSIAIDGPVAAGKSAVGAALAARLGYRFIDTGVMYRAVTWLALERGVELHDDDALARLAREAHLGVEASAEAPKGARVVIDGHDVTGELRSPEVSDAVSLVSRVAGVREVMVERQREMAREGGVVMAGRDIGTVVLPDAPLKVYLDATVEERVRRRREELLAGGRVESDEEVREELAMRDEIDSGRDVSPLRPAKDAIVIDTDHLSLDEVVAKILEASCS